MQCVLYLPTRIEKKNTPTIQLHIMKAISALFWGLLFFPEKNLTVHQIILMRVFLHTYGCCCLCCKIEASKVGVTHAIIDKAVAAYAFVIGDSEVSAGVEVDEEEHVEDGFDQTENVLIVTDLGIHPGEEFAKLPVFQKSRKSDNCILNTELNVKKICRKHCQGVI